MNSESWGELRFRTKREWVLMVMGLGLGMVIVGTVPREYQAGLTLLGYLCIIVCSFFYRDSRKEPETDKAKAEGEPLH